MLGRWRRLGDFGLALVPVIDGLTTFRLAFDVKATAVELPVVAPLAEPILDEPVIVPDALPAVVPDFVPPDGPALAPLVPTIPSHDPAQPPPPARAVPSTSRSDASFSELLDGVSSPSTPFVLGMVALVAVGLSGGVSRARTRRAPAAPVTVSGHGIGVGVGAAALLVAPTLLGEATVYKLGLVLILLVGAIGLHLLVNWAGELSLAHAALVGLPAFVVATVSSGQGVSPIVLLPLGVLVGLVAGAVVGLPAIRGARPAGCAGDAGGGRRRRPLLLHP